MLWVVKPLNVRSNFIKSAQMGGKSFYPFENTLYTTISYWCSVKLQDCEGDTHAQVWIYKMHAVLSLEWCSVPRFRFPLRRGPSSGTRLLSSAIWPYPLPTLCQSPQTSARPSWAKHMRQLRQVSSGKHSELAWYGLFAPHAVVAANYMLFVDSWYEAAQHVFAIRTCLLWWNMYCTEM